VTGSVDHVELTNPRCQCVHNLARGRHRNHGIDLAHAHQGRAADPGRLVDGVEPSKQFHAGRAHVEVLDPACQLCLVRDLRPEGGEDSRLFLIADSIAAVVSPGELGHLVTRYPSEPVYQASRVKSSRGGLQDQRSRVAVMAGAVQRGDKATMD